MLFIFIFIMKTSFSLCSCKKMQQIVFDGEMRLFLKKSHDTSAVSDFSDGAGKNGCAMEHSHEG
ncbi:hypothetical protein B2M23_16885 [Eubacterium limosum]|uniref:Uncharacterized protein n=1 Tax=Eubacterium limosum TaxID=1736 RepID=A0AAC9W499_EUBLI|nr:hypothetical protein B2M23_16885 [Eubacterium limosum]